MAVPRTSVEPPGTEVHEPRSSGGGLSIQTLVIAAVASGVAAVIVSHFWQRGTILASAMTPVVVSIISELLKKPVESEKIRGSVRAVSSVSRPRSGRTPNVMAPPRTGTERTDAGPVKIYSSGANKRPRSTGGISSLRHRPRVKLAIITGLVAFVIAAAALTLPELIFGGSVGGGGGGTTYFGGSSSSSKKDSKSDTKDENGDGDSTGGSDSNDSGSGDSTSPSDGGDRTTPSDNGSDTTAPEQTTPDQTQPPSSGSTTPAPQTPTTPAPAPTP